MLKIISFTIVLITCITAKPSENNKNYDVDSEDRNEDYYMHNLPKGSRNINYKEENLAAFWENQAVNTIKNKLKNKINTNIAKNVILFLGDGMSVPTVTAARIYAGGENSQLAFDKFPHTGISKTYCVDHQVPDSACTSTAYLSGVKGNLGTIGVTGDVILNDCPAMLNFTTHTNSIGSWFQKRDKSAGLVTTARVTHASPAGMYAHTAQRDWESDKDVLNDNQNPVTCLDIATQLITQETGQNLKVILGGGRKNFLPKDDLSGEGKRKDGINLIEQWKKLQASKAHTAEYVTSTRQLLEVKFNETNYLLGLFDKDHMNYNLNRDPEEQPSLEEMTEAAIRILEKDSNGYFLFVEGARIDMAHHDAKARKALDEAAEFSKAVAKAVELTNESETLIVVTSDHAHTMSISGYPDRGNDILGLNGKDADDELPYTTINYANGPGYVAEKNGKRHDVSKDDLTDINTRYSGIFPLGSETHGGDDVIIFAQGPWSHLFSGVVEQNVIPHIMAYASCTSYNINACD